MNTTRHSRLCFATGPCSTVTVTLVSADGTTAGLSVVGRDVLVDDVRLLGFLRGVDVIGAHRAVLRRVAAEESTQFGFAFTDCVGCEVERCRGDRSWLDEFKFLFGTERTVLRDCLARDNGQSYLHRDDKVGGGHAGDGIDLYAGGFDVQILGGDYSRNHGNGLTIKTDTLTALLERITVGRVVVRGVTCSCNMGMGVGVYGYDPSLAPPSDVEVSDCLLLRNGLHGLWFDAIDGVAVDNRCYGNGRHGLFSSMRAKGCFIVGTDAKWNSRERPGKWSNVSIEWNK